VSRPAVILLADDDASVRTVLSQALTRAGYDVRGTGNGATLWQWVAAGDGDLVVTDVVMPDVDGLDLLPRMRKLRPELRVIVMSARNTVLTALKAGERGAFEYLPKPFDLQVLVAAVERALRQGEAASLPVHEAEALPIVGRSPAMQEVYRLLSRAVATDLTVLISGESGTGKELVARALHDFGKRVRGPFVAINMAAMPRELIESELFGHEKGAFTGAIARSTGRFEQAAGGTLFLDEIGDMPPETQTRLLRVLQEGEYQSVGGRSPLRTDARIVVATHRDLPHLVRQGLFREDLYYRLAVLPIRLPPLRERSEDIPDLVQHFLARAAASGLPTKTFTPAALDRLRAHGWPGNVRELENLVRRLAALCSEDVIEARAVEGELAEVDDRPGSGRESLAEAAERHLRDYFAAHRQGLPAAGLYERVMREVERPLISLSLAATKGNQIRAAALLGLNRNTLRKKIRELDVQITRGLK